MRRPFLLLLCCWVLASCAVQPVAPEKAATYRRVGVLSAMGDTFNINAVGITVFGNEQGQRKAGFDVDELLTKRLVQALSGRYEVVDLGKYRAAFLAQPKFWPGAKGVFAPDHPMAKDVVRNLMGEEGLDAYVILTPASGAVRGTNQGIAGIGIVRMQRLFGSGDHRLHAAYIVAVVDGKDFSMVGDMPALPVGETVVGNPFVTSPLGAPNVPVAPDYWQNPGSNWDGIGRTLGGLMTQSLPETLQRARLL